MPAKLPKRWREVPFEDLCLAIETGRRPQGGARDYTEGTPSISGEHIDKVGRFKFANIRYIPNDFASQLTQGRVERNDILIVKDGATTGKIAFVNKDFPYEKAFVNEHVFLCKLSSNINPRYVYWFLWGEEGQERILKNFKGTAQGGINRTFGANTLIPVAPLREQKQIAESVDHILTRILSVQSRLDNFPKLIAELRQQILHQAVTGKLTKDWRRKRTIPRWKHDILTNVTKKIQIGPFGTQLHKKDYISGGIPLVNPTHIQKSLIVPDYDFAVSKKKYRELSNYVLLLGDIVMGRRGEMGRCALVTSKENKWLCGTGSLFIRPTREINSKYLFMVLSSEQTKQFLEGESKGITMKNLNSTIVGNIPIPVPQRLEQKKIITRVQILFRQIDEVEKQYQQLKKTSSELPHAILSKIYSGKLAPQNSKDEPVEKLLERLQEEKARLLEARKGLRAARHQM